jgi:hypothetical protein
MRLRPIIVRSRDTILDIACVLTAECVNAFEATGAYAA